MERVGWFTTDGTEAGAALLKLVFMAERDQPAGLEIAAAMPNSHLTPNIRRMKSSRRFDLPTMWRALLEPPSALHPGPIVALLAPRGIDPTDAGPTLVAAGITAPETVAAGDVYALRYPGDTPVATLVDTAVAALGALGVVAANGEWQWTVREQGLVPR